MKRLITAGATSQTVYVLVLDSSSTTGAGLTGLAYNTGSLVAYYVRDLAAAAAITLGTQTATGAWSSGGFVEVSSANMPGLYRLDLPDAVVAAGVSNVVVMLKGAANMVPVALEIQLAGGQIGAITGNTAQTGDAYARLGAPVGASISADIAAAKIDTAATLTAATLARKILKNRTETNPATGVMTIYDDDGTTPLYTANLYTDVAGATLYAGTAAVNRRNALS